MDQWKNHDESRFLLTHVDAQVGCLSGKHLASGYTMGRSELVEEVRSFGQRSAGKPWVLVKVTVTSTTYLSIVADHVQLFVEMVIPNSKNVPEMV